MAVFILEDLDVLSVKTDNASMAVFILRTHYPSRELRQTFVVCLVMLCV